LYDFFVEETNGQIECFCSDLPIFRNHCHCWYQIKVFKIFNLIWQSKAWLQINF